jgi:hypothetical protein
MTFQTASLGTSRTHILQTGGLGVVGSNPAAPTIFYGIDGANTGLSACAFLRSHIRQSLSCNIARVERLALPRPKVDSGYCLSRWPEARLIPHMIRLSVA